MGSHENDEREYYRMMCRSLPDPTLLINEKGIIKEASESAAEVIDHPRRELIGNHLTDFFRFFSEESQEKVQTNFQKYLRRKEVHPYTVQVKPKQAKKLCFELKADRIEVGGETRGILVTARNITQRVKVEEKLKDYKERLEKAMEVGNLAWWEMDIETGTVKYNKKKATMLGYSPNKFSHYTDFTSLIHPEDHERTMQAMRDHLNGKESRYEVDYRIKTKTGGYEWFHDVGGITKRSEDGEPEKVTGIVVNITERKQREEKLDALNAWGRKLNRSENMEEIFEHTLNAIEETLGFTYASVLLKEGDLLKVKAHQGYESLPERLKTFSLHGKGVTVEATTSGRSILVKDAQDYPKFIPPPPVINSELAVPIRIEGEVIGVVDVESKKKKAFDQRDKKLLEILTSHVAVAIKGLQEKRKRVSLQRLEELRNQFTLMAAHEFLTPLTSIKMGLEMLQKEYLGDLSKRQEEKLKRLLKDTDRLTRMLEHFRQLSRLRSDHSQLEKSKCRLDELLEEVLERYKDVLRNERIEVVQQLENALVIQCDKKRMIQVLCNLIENAIDYTDDKITIKGGQGEGTVWLKIEDNGPGIPEKDQEKIFESFHRVEKDRSHGDRRFYAGGLGLALCKQIVEAHNGTIEVDSTLGEGSTFTITLPQRP